MDLQKELDIINQEQIRAFGALADHNKEFIVFTTEYKIKPIQLEYENKIKSIDVIIDLFKFAIPIAFTGYIASFGIIQLSRASILILNILSGLSIILLIAILVRNMITAAYIKAYKEIYSDMLNGYSKGNKFKHEAAQFNLKALDFRLDRIRRKAKQYFETLDKDKG